jgi:ADP-ribose pyrophosphatase
VTEGLSEHQREALAAYGELLQACPGLFGGRERRPVVRDLGILEEYAREHRVVLGVALANPYLWLVNDLVRSRDSHGNPVLHPYLRIIAPPGRPGDDRPAGGSVVLATIAASDGVEDEIVLVEQERHATGRPELELPRGFAAPGVPPADQALAELREETGYLGSRAQLLGTTLTDSGTSDRPVSFFHVPVTGRTASAADTGEAILRTVTVPRAELWNLIEAGTVRDGFTVQALGLYERRLARAAGAF